ncbi:malonyl CoA-acyl carrier protein transacylase [Halorhodospira halochloris]|uniref:Malonyl CoA-acyl carrier protein transacylase n=1 Tax=Halorhodospira halochloris TaxID=1052 RepID=A0A0X8XAS4_HALHR|nr:ACP S-malonyltransferase [Halorhodospira halochloris]MBK1652086.1 [acyl-carrier-protein] S-malonyltransferase [Halorhodospira halochloris]BAU58008.1 malonyl CoA-acyl carrier protein transacylase [Halorhodospira halochloris]
MSTSSSDLAFVFPGQGSQSVGMMSAWAESTTVRDTFAEASQVLGYDIWQLSEQGPAEELDRTDRTQPAILTASVALWRLWQERGGKEPALFAGHSLGEYSALVAAGSLQFADAVELVAERGKYMQEAVAAGRGAMAAIIGLQDEQVIESCARAAQGQVVQAVNFNAPGQVVIAGDAEAVERAGEIARQEGAKRVLPLSVSVPSHCSLMQPAAERLADKLAAVDIVPPRSAVLHNVDVEPCQDPEGIRVKLVQQLANPVRWSETISRIKADGVQVVGECGPGKVLSGLVKRIEKSLSAEPLYEPGSFDKLLGNFS